MEFLSPTALYGLLALPLLLIPYLIWRKPRRMVFSSLLLLAESGRRPSQTPWGRLRLPPIFFLQLLLLALLVLALADPVFTSRPANIAIVLDNSASMQTLEGNQSRFGLAQEKARSMLDQVAANGQVDIYLTTPGLARLGGASLAPREAAGVIAGLEAYDLGDPAVDYKSLLSRLAQERKYERVLFITDHPSRAQGGVIRVMTVGTAKANLALTSFGVRRSSLANASLEASVEVSNFSSKDERIKIALRAGGAPIANRELLVGAGKSAAITMEAIPARPYYEAVIDARDALQLDNRRFAVAPMAANLRILGVSPRPQALTSLRAIPGVTLDVIAANEYQNTERGAYGLEIFHFAAPAALARTATLLVLPPDANELVDLGRPVSRPTVSGWREPHQLTRYVNFTLFRPSYGRPLKARTPAETVIESPQGPLALAVERQGTRHLVLGFDPFPYLGRDNLPMSIFTLNLIDWFFGQGRENGMATGELLAFGAQLGNEIVTPKGTKKLPNANDKIFAETYYQGIYQIAQVAGKKLVAMNIQDASESDLRNPAAIEIGGSEISDSGFSALSSYWPYLLLATLGLLLLEWFVNPRRAAGRSPQLGHKGVT